jgi:hypothetical protein
MVSITMVGRILFRIRGRKPLKGIGHPYIAEGISVSLEDGTHENGGSASPDTCFD